MKHGIPFMHIFRRILFKYEALLKLPPNANNKPSEWVFQNIPVPQQQNSWDCGPFVCFFAKCLLLKMPPLFLTRAGMAYFRKYMLRELLAKQAYPA